MTTEIYLPLTEYFSLNNWPLGGVIIDSLNSVYIQPPVVDEPKDDVLFGFRLPVDFALRIPGLDFLSLGVGSVSKPTATVRVQFSPLNIIIQSELTLRVDGDLLRPVKRGAKLGTWEPDLEARTLDIILGIINLEINADGNIDLDLRGTTISLPLCMIGSSGVVIEGGTMNWLTPTSPTVPAAAPAGFTGIHIDDAQIHLPDIDFLPPSVRFDDCFIGTGGFTGKVSFPANLEWDENNQAYKGDMAGELFGFKCGLTNIEIEFVQSCLVKGLLAGEMFVPYLDKRMGLELSLSMSGEFSVTVAAPQSKNPDDGVELQTDGLLKVRKKDLYEIILDSLTIEKHVDIYALRLSGDITPLAGNLKWPSFHVDELAIDSQGNVRLEGGWLNLPKQYAVDFHAFQFEITKLGFGQTDDGGKWLGFSGGIKLVEGLPAGASVEGLRIIWYDDTRPPAFTFNGIGVEFAVPGVLTFKGAVDYNTLQVDEGGVSRTIHRFDGTIKLNLITLNMEIDAILVVGSDSGPQGTYNFFAIYVGVELPAGIPIFNTGLALYGMAGLFAYQMEPNKGAAPNVLHPTSRTDEGWYENEDGGPGWYKRDEVGITNLKSKWDPHQGSLAFGVGATLGTLPDNGTSFHGKFLLVIVFPGPIIMLEGRGDLLKKRADQDGKTKTVREPLFRAIAILDGRLGTLTFGLGAQYKYDDNSNLIDISGSAEAFYDFNNPNSWHIYIGRDEPRQYRIHAYIFKKFFEANAYFMLDSARVQTGAWVGLKKGWTFGPLGLKLEISLDGQAKISRKPPHFYGHLLLMGNLDLRAFGFGTTINVEAEAMADVFDPFHLRLDLHGELKLPWPFPSFKKDITLEWGPEPVPPPLPLPLKEIAVEHLKVSTSWPLPRDTSDPLLLPNYDNGENFLIDPVPTYNPGSPAPANTPVVPLDSRPHLTFGRSVNDDAMAGVNVQPGKDVWERIGDPITNEGPVKARYGLQEIVLEKWIGGASPWQPVARKGAVRKGTTYEWQVSANPTGVKTLFGSWAPLPGENNDAIGQTKLWLWSKTGFDYTRHGSDSWDEWFAGRFPFYPCVPPALELEVCCDFSHLSPGQKLRSPWSCPDHPEVTLTWSSGGDPEVTVLDPPVNSLRRALCFPSTVTTPRGGKQPNQITVHFGRPGKNVKITPAGGDGHGGALIRRCVYFQGRPPGPGPITEQELNFTTQGAPGTSIVLLNGVSGLNCGGTLMIALPRPCLSAELTLSSQTVSPGNPANPRAEGHSRSGGPPATAQMSGSSQTETLRLEGRDIITLVVQAPGETVLNQLCLVYVTLDGTASDEAGNIHTGSVGADGVLAIEHEGLRDVNISGGDQVCIVKVCVTLPPEPAEVDRREAMAKHFQDELARWSQQGDLLEPHTIYRLKVVTSLVAIGVDELDGYKQDLTQTEYSFFRTQGPPGIAHLSLPPGSLPREEDLLRDEEAGQIITVDDQGNKKPIDKIDDLSASYRFVLKNALNDLSPYVRQTIPPTVPAPAQKPPLPRPVYRAYDTGVEFNEDYVELMYRQQRRGLALYLYDSNNRPARDAEGRLIVLENRWGETEDLNLNDSELLWIARLNANNCGSLDEQSILRDRTLTMSHADLVLDPDTVYEARLTPLLLDEDFTADLSGWQVVDEGTRQKPSVWTVINHKKFSGASATIVSSSTARTVMKLDGSPDLKKLIVERDILILAGDTARSSHRYRIVGFDTTAGMVTVDGVPKFSGASSAWEIPSSGTLMQTSSINGGSLDGRDPVKPGTMLLRGDSTWTDYRLSVTLRSSDWGALGVVFRASDPTHYYRFSMAGLHKYRRLVRVLGTTHRVLAEEHFVYQQDHDYQLIVEAIGSLLRVYLDGALVFDVTDTALDKGGIGLYCWNNSETRFTDLRLDDFRKEAVDVYSYKFTTSRFADFFHHLHSFQDETWLRNVTKADLTAAAALSSTPTEAETRAYTALVENALGASAYQDPLEVQVTRLEDGNTMAGLLVQSPEPIDWQRLALEVSYTSRSIPRSSIPGAVKLTRVDFDPSVPNNEFVDLLLREAVNLSGYRIEQLSFPSGQPEPADAEILFSDTFERQATGLLFKEQFGPNALDHYTLLDEAPPGNMPHKWEAAANRIEQRAAYRGGTPADDLLPTHPGTIALLNSGEWSNVRIHATLLTDRTHDIGLVFRCQDEDNYYRFSISNYLPAYFRRLVKKVAGVITVLWEDKQIRYDTSQPCRLVIETFGDRLTLYLDNALQFSLSDPSFLRGRVGFYCWGNDRAYFENLQVEAIESDSWLWQPPFQTLDEVTLVEEENAVDGPAVWQAQSGTLRQSSKMRALEGQLQVMSGAAYDIALSSEGLACVVGTDPTRGGFGIYIWTGDSWDRIAEGAVRIAAGPERNMLWVDDVGQIFTWTRGRVDQLPGLATDISASWSGPIWIVGTDPYPGGFMVSMWDGSSLQPMSIGALRIAVDPDGYAWIVDDAHHIFKWDGNTWQQLPGEANDISIGADGTAWIIGNTPVGNDFGIYRWGVQDWEAMAGSAIAIAVGPDGQPWLVDSAQRILRWSGSPYHQPGTYALGGDSDWQDVQISVKLRSDSDGAIGVMFRYLDEDNYYRFSMDRKDGYRRLIKKVGGVVTRLWEDNWLYTQGRSYELTLRAMGSELRGYLDGKPVFTWFDGDLSHGQVGLYCRGNDAAHFERVVVLNSTRRIGRWTIHDEGDQDAPSMWQLAGGALQQISTIHGGNAPDDRGTYAVAGDPAWADYRLSVRLRSDEPGAIGVLFRYVDRDNYYRFSMDQKNNYRRLIKKAAGQLSVLWEDTQQSYQPGDVYVLAVEANGKQLSVYLGDTRLCQVNDGAHTVGQIGLYCANNDGARFEYVEVSTYPANQSFADWMLNEPFDELVPERWQFVDKGTLNSPSIWSINGGFLTQTSNIRFNPLLPGVDSNQPATFAVAGDLKWTDYRFLLKLGSNFVLGSNVQSTGVLFRYQDDQNYYRFTLDYLQGVALLVSRVSGQVKTLWQGSPSFAVGQTYDLCIDCLGPLLRGYLDGTLLFEIEDSNLASGQVGLACTANPGAFFTEVRLTAPIWRLYYPFREEKRRDAGTRVRIFSGNQKDAPALVEGMLQRFVAAPGETGNLHFPSDHVDLRLRAPDGSLGHQRRFLPSKAYATQSAQDWRILRKADGTGFFLCKLSATLPVGQYRLKLTYARDNRSKGPDSQVLSKAGDTNSEEVIIDIPWPAIKG